MLRRGRFVVGIAIAILLLLAWYVGYTRQVVRQLRAVAATQGKMYNITMNALQDTTSDADPQVAIIQLQGLITESGLPLVVTNKTGRISASANVPGGISGDAQKEQAFIAKLDRKNQPIEQPGLSTIHYGDSPIISGLEIFPVLQASAIVLLLAFAFYALRERGRADREKVWAGMAREAAHQLGTPLSSIGGWLELLGERDNDVTSKRAIEAMQQDLVRLDRVSHRFERIGRPPRNDSVDAAALVERLASYFAARAPTLARHVEIVSERPADALTVHGDGVLLEWVLEVLIKNAIDALGGRNGKIIVSAAPLPEGGARIRVSDDGPGIPRELRKRIFDAGFSTKQSGWGIGLSLARRIVEENHGGKLILVDTDTGAVFDVILHA
ncbi:MAG: HAMP domain-containing sensor histidine kinase [Gemmatimonadaceae bacterium]